MRYFFVLIFIFFFVTNKVNSDVIKPIIINLEKADNYNFKFKQQINKKIETGTCILVFDRHQHIFFAAAIGLRPAGHPA